MTDIPTDDIADDIRAAFDEVEGTAPEPKAPETPNAAPARAPDGKFAPKQQDVVEAKPDGAEPPKVEAEKPIGPPASLSAPVKAMWATLPAEVQQDLVRRERETTTAIEERSVKLKGYEPWEAALAPVKDRLSTQGVTPDAYIRSLVAADQWLQRNPAEAMQYLARQYGAPQVQVPQAGAPNAPTPPVDIDQRVTALVNARLAAEQEAQASAKVQGDVETFSKDPAHPYFENVRPIMAGLLSSGQSPDLKDAYEKACWADPTVRGLLMKDQAEAAAKAQRDAASQRTQQAKRAGGSVTGSPGPGGSAVTAAQTGSTIRDDVRAAYDEVMGRA